MENKELAIEPLKISSYMVMATFYVEPPIFISSVLATIIGIFLLTIHCRLFRNMDDDGSKALSFSEFQKGVYEYGVDIEEQEVGMYMSGS